MTMANQIVAVKLCGDRERWGLLLRGFIKGPVDDVISIDLYRASARDSRTSPAVAAMSQRHTGL